ncbi:two pore channel protein 2-like isoform X2 [Halichondria panicea]
MKRVDVLSEYRINSATYTGSYGTVDSLNQYPNDQGTSPAKRSSRSSINTSPTVLNINNLPLPTNTKDTALLQSAVFILDGIKYRSIQHKIDPLSLSIYQVYHSRPFQWLLKGVLLLLLMLAFFEYPTSFSLSSDYRFRNQTWFLGEAPCGTTEAVEIVCLIFILCDCMLRFYLGGWKRFVRKPWLVLYAVMIGLSFIDVFISIAFCDRKYDPLPMSLAYTLRMRRYFRPIFFLISSTIMKKFAKAVALTLPHIFTVLVLLVIHMYVFAMIGLLVFPHPPDKAITNTTGIINSTHLPDADSDLINPNLNYSYYTQQEGERYFRTVADALESLLVLLTTANHPDVMMPIYQYNRFSAIYFILFLGIGSYIILNLLIAVIYNHFKGFFQNSLQSSFLRRRVAFRAAFTILIRKTQDLMKRSSQRNSYSHDHVGKDLVRELLQRVKIKESQKPLMYQKLETVNSQFISWKHFREVFDLISQDTSRRRAARLPYYTNVRVFQWFQFIIRHRIFAYFTHFVSIVNVIIITVELQLSYSESLSNPDSRLAGFNLFFVSYYVLEQILKLIGFGLKGYFRSIGNIYEGLLTLALLILEILALALYGGPLQTHAHLIDVTQFDIIIRLMNIFIVLRILRILAHVEKLKILTATIFELIRNLRGFSGIIFVIYYIFALLGMQLFMDVDGPSHDPTLRMTCGTYDKLRYFANNFHDFASSLMVLWDVMVVNNWFILLDKYGTDSFLGNWAKLYFIAWWLVAVIIFVNLFISLVLETFLVKWEAVHRSQEENPPGEYEGREGEAWERQATQVDSQISDIHNLLRAQLVEPEESRIMHELQRHHDLMLV